MAPLRPQQYRISWPLTPQGVEDIDTMFETLFKALRSGGVVPSPTSLLSSEVGPGNMGPPGDTGEDGTDGVPGALGTAGATGSTGSIGPQGPMMMGPSGADGEDGDPGVPGPRGAAGASGAFALASSWVSNGTNHIGNSMTGVTTLICTNNSLLTVIGITAGADGQVINVSADSTGSITFNNEDGTSTALDRILTPTGANFSLPAGGSCTLVYDGQIPTLIGRWRLTLRSWLGSYGQIPFPATQNPSSDANTLDDYEEGTWTPTDASGASLVLGTATGTYIKIGTLVFINGVIVYPVTVNASAAAIGGLPFTPASTGAAAYPLTIGYTSIANLTSLIFAAGASLKFYALAVAKTNANMTATTIYFSGAYPATA